MTVEDALQRILGGCVRHWVDNEAAAQRGARPEGPAPAAGGTAPAALGAEPVQGRARCRRRAPTGATSCAGCSGPWDRRATSTSSPPRPSSAAASGAPRRPGARRPGSSSWRTGAGRRTRRCATPWRPSAMATRLRSRLLGRLPRLAPRCRYRRPAGAAPAGTRFRHRHPGQAASAGAQTRPRFRRAQPRGPSRAADRCSRSSATEPSFLPPCFPAARPTASARRRRPDAGSAGPAQRCRRGAACRRAICSTLPNRAPANASAALGAGQVLGWYARQARELEPQAVDGLGGVPGGGTVLGRPVSGLRGGGGCCGSWSPTSKAAAARPRSPPTSPRPLLPAGSHRSGRGGPAALEPVLAQAARRAEPPDHRARLAQGGRRHPAGPAAPGDRRAGQSAHAPRRRPDQRGRSRRRPGAGLGVRRGQHGAFPGQARRAQADPQGPQDRGPGRQPAAPPLEGDATARDFPASGSASRSPPGSATARSMANSPCRA